MRDELTAEGAPEAVREWASNLPEWVSISAVDSTMRDDPRWSSLDLGERAAIALAAARQPAILLLDERKGTQIARALGFDVLGTLGVLDEAARRRLISLREMIERLKATSFRYPRAVVERLLEEDTQRNS